MNLKYLLISNVMSFVFCIAVLIFVQVMTTNRNRSGSRLALKKYINMGILCLFADMLSYVFDMQSFFGAVFFNHVSMIIAIFSTVVLGYCANRLYDSLFDKSEVGTHMKIVYLLPVIVTGILLIFNIFFGFLFEIGEGNIYRRGSHYFLSALLQYFYFGVLALRAVIEKRTSVTMKRQRFYTAMILVGVFSIFFGAAQIAAMGKVALHCYGLTLGVLTVFTYFLNDQITQDRLTGLNNRYALDNHMYQKMEEYTQSFGSERRLYLVMLDLDGFKLINDQHGHMAGDEALKKVAVILKRVAQECSEPIFIARFGGDEFAAVYEGWNEQAVIKLCSKIKESVAQGFANEKYKLSISAGYAAFDTVHKDIAAWYSASDKALYSDKSDTKRSSEI